MKSIDRRWWALTGISLLAFTAFLDFTIVNTALPFIQKAFHASILQLQWITNIFSIVLSMTMIAGGKLADLWGRKKVFYFGVFIFAAAAFGAGFSPNMGCLIFFRALQGLGATVLFVTSAALISDTFPAKEQPRAISIYSGITGSGLMLGPFFGGILIGLLDWRWVFWVNLPLIAAGFIFCSFSLKHLASEKHEVKIDLKGLFLLIFGLGALIYGIIEAAQSEGLLPWFLISLGILALAALIWIEQKSETPLLDLSIVKDKLILLAVFSCSLAGIISYVFLFFDPLYLRILRELSPFAIGLLIAMMPAAQVVISLIYHFLVKQFGTANLLVISVTAAFLAVLAHRWIGLGTPLSYLALPFTLLGINWGLSNAATITAVNQRIPSQKIGEAIGTVFTTWNVIGSIFVALSSVIFYAFEKKSFAAQLYTASIPLSPKEADSIAISMKDATEAAAQFAQIAPDKREILFDFFRRSFLDGFYSVVDFNLAFMFLVLFAAFWMRVKIKGKGKDRLWL